MILERIFFVCFSKFYFLPKFAISDRFLSCTNANFRNYSLVINYKYIYLLSESFRISPKISKNMLLGRKKNSKANFKL